jgi:hypothetical protein
MDKMDETKQADLWTWIVIVLIFGAVTAALYGPFVWEHWADLRVPLLVQS